MDLIEAAENGNIQRVSKLLDSGIDPNIKNDSGGWTALIEASYNDHIEIVEILLDRGADINIRNNDGYTALSVATDNLNLEMMKLLLDKGADPNNYTEESILGWIASTDEPIDKKISAFKLLLEAGANPNKIDDYGNIERSIFDVIDYHDNVEIVELLLKYGVDPNNRIYRTKPLNIASAAGAIKIVETLLSAGADPDSKDYVSGNTPLMEALNNNHLDIVELLLSANADPNLVNYDRDTALMYAIENEMEDNFLHTNIIEMLLLAGADPYIRDKHGDNSLQIARMYRKYGILHVIESYIEEQSTKQNLAFAKSLNPRLCDDSVLRYLDEGNIIEKIMGYPKRYDPSINIRMLDEARRDQLTKSRQRLASMRSMHSREGPFRSIRYEPNIMRGISEYLSRMGPVPSVQERLMLEDRQTGSGSRRRSRSSKRRKKYTYNRFYF